MANIPANATAITLKGGQSTTGSYAGFVVCPNTAATPQGTVGHFNGLKDANGNQLVVSASALYFTPGYYPIFVTSASLDTTSNNVVFFT